jgi:hypothetical protein
MPKIGEIHRGGRESLEIPGLPWPQESQCPTATHRQVQRGKLHWYHGSGG